VDPPLKSLSDTQAVLAAASQYRMDGVLKRMGYLLKNSTLVKQEPVGVYAIAIRFGLRDAAVESAKRTLRLPLFGRPYQPELESISGGDIHRLQEFHTKCTAGIRDAALGPSILFGLSRFEWITRDSFVWFTCTTCTGAFRSIDISGDRRVQPRRWWTDYMDQLASALAEAPCFETVLKSNITEKAIDGADPCDVCRRRVVYDMKVFHEMLVAKIDRVIDEVGCFEGTPGAPS
jgi:hypothetical protein